ncbi:MAG: spore coat protein YlbD [Bacilli bacterium]
MSATHPAVEKFKQFVLKHPKLIAVVQNEQKTWQTLFEEWYLLGENDPYWTKYKDEEATTVTQTKNETKSKPKSEGSDGIGWSSVMGLLKGIRVDNIGGYLTNFNQTLSTIQDIVGTFSPERKEESEDAPLKKTVSVKSLKD